MQTTSQLHAELTIILDEVNERVGIRTSKNPTGNKTFSADVLKIEKCGPDEDYLTVIDVPGIFRITTAGATTEKDRDLVRNMVKNYIRDSRTIILAVLPCNVDVVTQEILALAEECDKIGDRTLGILTKPDLVRERSAQAVVCNLVEGKKRPLNLGYYVVRNRGGDDDHNASFDVEERDEMFKEDPWRCLPDERLGITALRRRLQELLSQITDKAFPKLRLETRQMLGTAQGELAKLGPTRQTERAQQQYLVAIAGRFQNMVRAALDADYSTQEAFAADELRLITLVVNITERFNSDFMDFSHAYIFETGEKEPLAASVDDNEEDDVDEFDQLISDDFSDLDEIIVTDWAMQEPEQGIMKWIRSMYHRSRGLELGTFGPRLLSSAFREQSSKWSMMTRQYMSKIILAIHRFILKTLEVVCSDERVREELMSRILNDLLPRYSQGMKQAMLLVDVERQQRPYTLNHYFNSNLQTSRGAGIKEELKGQARKESGQTWGKLVIELDKIQSAIRNRSNVEHAAEDIHDILESYYKVARKRFVDNVYHQAVDHCLLSGPESPLVLFSERWVLDLDTEMLAAIAPD